MQFFLLEILSRQEVTFSATDLTPKNHSFSNELLNMNMKVLVLVWTGNTQ